VHHPQPFFVHNVIAPLTSVNLALTSPLYLGTVKSLIDRTSRTDPAVDARHSIGLSAGTRAGIVWGTQDRHLVADLRSGALPDAADQPIAGVRRWARQVERFERAMEWLARYPLYSIDGEMPLPVRPDEDRRPQ
jgi:hypothetical protein